MICDGVELSHDKSLLGVSGSSICSHLSATWHSFGDKDIVILDKEGKWFERGVKQAIYICRENPSIKKGLRNIDIEYNKRLDRQRPCLEDDLTAGSNNIVKSNKSVWRRR